MRRSWTVVLAVGVCVGCETKPPPSAAVVREAKKPASPPEPQAPVFAPPPDPHAKAPLDKPVEVEMVRERARPGITDKGKYDPSIIGTPLTANFSLKEQLLFEVAIPKALDLFEQSRNRKVASHQEFMQEIIGKSNLRLPPLPPQHRYIYDPDRGELMIERPKGAE